MITANEYACLFNEYISRQDFLPDSPRGLFEPIAYMLGSGGKRLRPVLLLATCEALGTDFRKAIGQAVGIEMFHNFTLLHDDVMDRSDMRHGRPTVHRRWNEATAILSGDAMLTLAQMWIMRADSQLSTELANTFNLVAMDVFRGQQYDMEFETRGDVSVDEYLEMIRLKTGVLIAGACLLGATVARASESDCDAMWRYGINMGLAFQLQDDYLDTFGDPAVFGKAIGGDIACGKKTWLLINAMNEADRERLSEALAMDDREAKIAEITAIYRELDLDNRCRCLINGYTRRALQALDEVEMSEESRAIFVELAEKAAVRDR